jgi:hypothetical protein
MHGVSVFRVNAKGRAGIWRCKPHLEVAPPKDVANLVEILEQPARKEGR